MVNWVSTKDAIPVNDHPVLIIVTIEWISDNKKRRVSKILIAKYRRKKNGNDYWASDVKYDLKEVFYWAKLPAMPNNPDIIPL